MIKKNIILSIFFLILLHSTLLVSGAGYQPLRIEPSRFIFEGKPGDRFTGTIYVTNKGIEDADTRAVLIDWSLNQANKVITFEEGVLDTTLSGNIKFNPRRFIIPPGKTQIVRFTADIPNDMNAGEMRGMIAFEQSFSMEEGATGASVNIQVTSTIYLTILPANRLCEITSAQLITYNDNIQSTVALNLKGNGTAHFRGKGRFMIYSPGGNSPIVTGEFPSIIVLPETEVQFESTFKEVLDPGEYHVVFIIESEEPGKEPIKKIFQYIHK